MNDGTDNLLLCNVLSLFACTPPTAREAEMRQLRKTNMEYEERNAALQKHVESMRGAVERLEGDVMQERGRNGLLQQHLETLRQALASSFAAVPLPGESRSPLVTWGRASHIRQMFSGFSACTIGKIHLGWKLKYSSLFHFFNNTQKSNQIQCCNRRPLPFRSSIQGMWLILLTHTHAQRFLSFTPIWISSASSTETRALQTERWQPGFISQEADGERWIHSGPGRLWFSVAESKWFNKLLT